MREKSESQFLTYRGHWAQGQLMNERASGTGG